ncbi:MAG: rhodanese-like domain-containing protein [Lutibacter sp.]
MIYKIKTVFIVFVFASATLISCKNTIKGQAENNTLKSQTKQQKEHLTNGVIELTPTQFKEQSTGNLILDIRTPSEFKEGSIKGAKNIDFLNSNFFTEINKIDKSTPIYVYCRSGHRSGIATRKMKDLGFKTVYNLIGGVNSWQKKQFQLTK